MAKTNNKSGVAVIVIVCIIIILAVVASIISRNGGHVPKNPQGTIGNTPGNIINQGYFCESDGVVYFANSYDGDCIYSMNPDETNIKKLVSAKTKYINAGGKYLYYYMSDSTESTGLGFIRRVMGIYRCKKTGKDIQTVSRFPSLDMILINNDIYYQHYDNQTAVSLYKVSTDGQNEECVLPEIVSPSGVYDDIIYYANQDGNHFLMILDTVSDSKNEYLRYNVWYPIRQGEYIYFLDVDNNFCLSRYNLSTQSVEKLTDDRVDAYNLNDQYIYYQKNSSQAPALMRISLDGSNPEIISEGNYTAINITSRYVYFRPFDKRELTYRTPAYGSINVSEFKAAYDVVNNK